MNNLFDSPALNAIRALDDSPAMRAIRAIEDSPSIRMMRELNESPAMQVIRQFEDSPAVRTMRDMADSPALKAIKGLEESSAFKAIQKLQESPALRAMRMLEKSPGNGGFSRIAEQINHGYGALTFSKAYELLASEYDQQSDLEPLDVLANEVQERASRAPLGPLSAEFYLNLILALFLFYISQISALESEEKIIERMNSFKQAIATQLNELHEIEKDRLFLVADRTMNLRSGPGVDHDVIGIISKNQKLMELEQDRDWTKVEYFDHINNENVVGWAHSRYLLVISSDAQEGNALTKHCSGQAAECGVRHL
ncbi:SH3 domain-containing protein [Nitrosococcus watsonii]|uniref:SH3 type 3 domain protein n=1 Tax=Nitrosococcus watsoni (strain C-113) TaxID=105559 RepID=D8K9R7_NITWC|nr:SH3 domain-containing protein [Nitrosococcus watsonii]ADJ27356.1 SH3 type 3 domain protein [Nitrosococcus watsonii C-113]